MDCQAQPASSIGIQHKHLMEDHLMAIEILSASIKSEPTNYELYFERSICHYKLGDFKSSFDDVNTAIRLNKSDTNIHLLYYQKGLALASLTKCHASYLEAKETFKKAIAFLSMQQNSSLMDIWKLLTDASKELTAASKRGGWAVKNQSCTTITATENDKIADNIQGTSGSDPVDSTTDRPLNQQARSSTNSNQSSMTSIANIMKTGNNKLVATNCNNTNTVNNINNTSTKAIGNANPNVNANDNAGVSANGTTSVKTTNNNAINIINRVTPTLGSPNNMLNRTIISSGVTSSASHKINHHDMTSVKLSSEMANMQAASNLGTDLLHRGSPSNLDQQAKNAQFEWNIRRSERIFLHHSVEPGTSGPQFGLMVKHGDSPGLLVGPAKQKTGSNPSSVTSGRSAIKRPHDNGSDLMQYHDKANKIAKSRDGTDSHVDSDVDVDDSYNSSNQSVAGPLKIDEQNHEKRVLIAPSSSMPATTPQGPSGSSPKEDSYSSKYKRLRRDRERARRGTSKLCTIRTSDLDELRKPPEFGNGKRSMRVIAPIDGWLYSGQLSVDDDASKNSAALQYVVKLDGDATGSSYLFSQETVLNDVIKEVRVKSVSELRKGARICCYWNRQVKCLSTGVVTSRTFEVTKSLVSVKYDNGDLSALPLDDLRLLPPDYPKYMSNCDPLLLARNGQGAHITAAFPGNSMAQDSGTSRVTVDCKQQQQQLQPIESDLKPPTKDPLIGNGDSLSIAPKPQSNPDQLSSLEVIKFTAPPPTQKDDPQRSSPPKVNEEETTAKFEQQVERSLSEEPTSVAVNGGRKEDDHKQQHDDATIPPTDEVIDFITSEDTLKSHQQDHENHHQQEASTPVAANDANEMLALTKDEDTTQTPNDETSQLVDNNNSRASSEENNYGIEYCPWVFDGVPKRTKRHGRTYRDNYPRIRRGNEMIRVGDSAELMPRDESILPFIAKIEGLWATSRGEMRVKVRWYYRLVETEGEPFALKDGENALFETDHFDENDVQSIYRTTKILPWNEYSKSNLGHVNNSTDKTPKIFYLAGYYDPVRRIKHLKSDVKEAH